MKSIEQNFKENPNLCWHKLVAEAGAFTLKNECQKKCEGYSCYVEGKEVMFCRDYIRVKNLEFVGKVKNLEFVKKEKGQ